MKFFSIFFVFFLVSCGLDMRFQVLYSNQDFEKAYLVLQLYDKKDSLYLQRNSLKTLLILVSSGKSEYADELNRILEKSPGIKESDSLKKLASLWLDFSQNPSKENYLSIKMLLPKKKFTDHFIEKIRILLYAEVLFRLEEFSEVLSLLNSSSLTIKHSDLLYIRGVSYWYIKSYTRSEKDLKKVIKTSRVEDLQALAYFYLGDIYEKENDPVKALELYFTSWNLNPKNETLNFRIGRILQQDSFTNLHYRFLRASLRLNKEFAEAWYYLSNS